MTDQQNNPVDNSWTMKLPLLVAGVVALVVGGLTLLRGHTRAAIIGGLVLVGLGLCFVTYSFTIKEWCVPAQASAFSSGMHHGLRGCLRWKGWYEP